MVALQLTIEWKSLLNHNNKVVRQYKVRLNDMTNQRHYFLAIPLPNDVRDKIKHWQGSISLPFKSWVYSEDYHITLAFLGGVTKEQRRRLSKNLNEIKHRSFSLTLTHLGTFGLTEQPRILWVGVNKQPALFHLQRDIVTVCTDTGFQLDKRVYHPHITVARKYIGTNPFNIQEHESSFSKFIDTTWAAQSFVLYETHLDKKPKYEVVERYELSD